MSRFEAVRQVLPPLLDTSSMISGAEPCPDTTPIPVSARDRIYRMAVSDPVQVTVSDAQLELL